MWRSASSLNRRSYLRASSIPITTSATAAADTLPVTEDGALFGLVTMDYVGEFLMIQAEWEECRVHAAAQFSDGPENWQGTIDRAMGR
jgi:hypothetical protein